MVDKRSKERTKIFNQVIEQPKEDDIDLFFRSIAASVKKLPTELVNEAKMRSLQMIFDLQNQNKRNFNQITTHLTSPSSASVSSVDCYFTTAPLLTIQGINQPYQNTQDHDTAEFSMPFNVSNDNSDQHFEQL